MKKAIIVFLPVLLLLVSGCGGQGNISLSNATGRTLDTITLTVGEASQTWTNISPDEVFTSRLEIPPGEVQCNITWAGGGFRDDLDFLTIDRGHEAKKVSIIFSKDELSVGYEF